MNTITNSFPVTRLAIRSVALWLLLAACDCPSRQEGSPPGEPRPEPRPATEPAAMAPQEALDRPATAKPQGEDWPTYRHDDGRSGVTPERIDTQDLRPAWIHRPSQPPQQAFHGPARWDAAKGVAPMADAEGFDTVFHVVAAGDRVYYGSSADDAVVCLDAGTGRERWAFTTGGPVRLPPTILAGKLYFGSDDGSAYCVTADRGELVWRFNPTEGARGVFLNGRLISRCPVRSGVVVRDGTAYFAASLLPMEPSYLCAVDAAAGTPDGPGRGVRRAEPGATFMGMLAADGRFLLAPQGRNSALLLALPELAPAARGGAGTFAMLAGGHMACGPGAGTLLVQDWDLADLSRSRAHAGRTEACYVGDRAYVIAPHAITAFARDGWKPLWTVKAECSRMIAAGDLLFIGSRDEVRAHRAADGREVWRADVPGRADGLAVAGGALYVATTDGPIYCFRPGARAAADAGPGAPGPKTADAVSLPYSRGTPPPALDGRERALADVSAGPYAEFTDPATAVIRWRTPEPSPTILQGGAGEALHRDDRPTREHEVRVGGLRPLESYAYRIATVTGGREGVGPTYLLEGFFNTTAPDFHGVESPYPQDALTAACAQAAERIAAGGDVAPRGIALVVGCGDGRLAFELARRTALCVIGLEADPDKVAAARAALRKTGRYGVRVSVRQVRSYTTLDAVPDACANLVVSQAAAGGEPECPEAEIRRILRPLGGVAVLGDKVLRRPDPLPGSADWSHQYGDAANAAFAGETLQGVSSVSNLVVQWLGRPGPRHQADRQVRKPAPLARKGRLFSQGMGRVMALDAYNGVVLWSLEIPGLNRYNMPREGGNWCADDDFVYLVHGGACWKIEAATGVVRRIFDTVDITGRVTDPAWSHVALAGDLLLGSTARAASHYADYWGSDCWYDARIGATTGKILSLSIHALNKDSGAVAWSYGKGLILNSSITVGPSTGSGQTPRRVYFVENRDEKTVAELLTDHGGRMFGGGMEWRHVALDAATGAVLWDRPFTGDLGMTAFYQAYADETLVTVGCSRPYKTFGYDARTGEPIWAADVPLDGEGHGGATQHPVIVGGRMLLCTSVVDLKTGAILGRCPRGNCGTAAASTGALIHRAGSIALWPLDGRGEATAIAGVRPDCWLSAVPACGMLLAPEGGGGCSCGGWLRTSMGFIPRAAR